MATQKSWNKAAGFEMWKAGKSDKEIGDALGVTAANVSYFRKKYWETCHQASQQAEPTLTEPETTEGPRPEQEEVIQDEPAVDEMLVSETSAGECTIQKNPLQEDEDEDKAKLMIQALEIFVQNLKGMKAVMTFQILQALWDWETVEDLERAKIGLEYLIELEGGKP